MGKRFTLLSAALFLGIVGLLPLLVMLAQSIWVKGQISFTYYGALLSSGREWTLLAHSLILSLLTTLMATLLGLPLGILFGKTDLPFRRLFIVLFTLPLLIPPYITAISWFNLLGRGGMLSRILSPGASKVISSHLFGLPGCVMVLTSAFLPIVILLTITYLNTIDPALEEAGRLVAGWRHVLKAITIPLISPGILLADLLVFLLTLGEFGVPSFLRYSVFPVESFTQFSAFYNVGTAAAAAAPLVIMTLLALAIERAFLHNKTYHTEFALHTNHILEIKLGSLRKWMTIGVGLICLVTVILPLSILILRSFDLEVYREALIRAGDSLLRSIIYASIGASALTGLGFLLGYLVFTRAFCFWRGVDTLTIFLFVLSGTVIGIGLIRLWNRPSLSFIYGTPVMILLGYLAHYIAIPHRMSVSALAHLPPSLEEAAQVAGAGWFFRMTRIIIPLVWRALAAGWLLSYIFCMRDTGIAMLVYPPGHDTLPARIFTLMANGSPQLIAALCVLTIVASLLPLGLGGMMFKRLG